MEGYRKSSHAVYRCEYHFVWIPKYRYQVLVKDIKSRLKEILTELCEWLDIDCCNLISPGAVGLVEQNVVFSVEISKRGYVLENGRIVMEGEGKELLLDEHIKKAYLAI